MSEREPGRGMPEDEHATTDIDANPQVSPELLRQQSIEARLTQLVDSLATESERTGFDLVAESYLSRLGVREPLRQSGILPPEDPNPHDIDSEPEAYAHWWNEHPDLDPWQSQLHYEETLKILYIGARIGFLAGKLLNRVPLRLIDDTPPAVDS